MARSTTAVSDVVAMIAVIVTVDGLIFNHFREQLMVSIGVLVCLLFAIP